MVHKLLKGHLQQQHPLETCKRNATICFTAMGQSVSVQAVGKKELKKEHAFIPLSIPEEVLLPVAVCYIAPVLSYWECSVEAAVVGGERVGGSSCGLTPLVLSVYPASLPASLAASASKSLTAAHALPRVKARALRVGESTTRGPGMKGCTHRAMILYTL